MFLASVLATGLLLGQLVKPVTTSRTRLIFEVVDIFGKRIPFRLLSLRSLSGDEFADRFLGLTGLDIPYGHYSYVLVRAGTAEPSGQTKGEVYLSVPERIIRVKADRGPNGDPSVSVERTWPKNFVRRGRIPSMIDAALGGRIRFQSLYDGESYEYEVDKEGTFFLRDILAGDFAVYVFQQEQLVCMQPIRFPFELPDKLSKEPLLIDPCRPPTWIANSN
jgi:hypothetical protein